MAAARGARGATDGEPARVDLWPKRLGCPAWTQSSTAGEACTAFAIGAAAYWHELRRRPKQDPGTPDFQFLYNNEAFLTSSVVRYFVALEKGEHPQALGAFRIRAAARAAAVFGVHFLPRGVDYTTRPFTFTPAPPYTDFRAALRHLYVFQELFHVRPVDPNDPVLSAVPFVGPRRDVVRRTLAGGTPVVVGINLFAHTTFRRGRISPLPSRPGDPSSAHAVLLVGYDDARGCFRFRNSWGPDWGVSGYGELPYEWVDSKAGTFGFTSIGAPNGLVRRRVMFDQLTLTNRSAATVRVNVDGYNGIGSYLGGESAELPPNRSVLLHPVRWLATYRLDVVVSGPGAAVRGCRMLVDDADGAMASGASITVPARATTPLAGHFLRVRGTRLRTHLRGMLPSEHLIPAPPGS